jgi:hypothetical protein
MEAGKSGGIPTSLNRTCVHEVRAKIPQQELKFRHDVFILAWISIARDASIERDTADSGG